MAIASRGYLNGKIKKVLVVAPTSICFVWTKEFEASTIPYEAIQLTGSSTKKVECLKKFKNKDALQVAVVNYESSWRILDDLIKWAPDMVILDESQKIKNPKANMTKAMHKLGDTTKYKLILTGTPVTNTPLDTFGQWRFLDKSLYGTSFYTFKNRYARMGGYMNHQVIGYQNLNELTEKAHSIAYRVTKEQALDLPEMIDTYRYVELEDKAKKIYKDLKKECLAELENNSTITATNVLTQMLRLQQVTGGFLNDDDGKVSNVSNAKLNELKDIIEDVVIDNKKKVVVFVRFIKEIESIKKMLEELKIKYSAISGETKERGEEVRKFQEEEDVMVFVGQLQTTNAGLTLTASHTAVFYSLDFNYANYIQAKARIHRISQKSNCTYIHLVVKDTIDEKVLQAMKSKQNIATKIVDDWKEYI